MQTRDKLRALSKGARDHQLGEGPLSGVAETLVAEYERKHAERMADAGHRAELAGNGAYVAAIQRLVKQVKAGALHDNATPAVMCHDLYAALKDASKDNKSDSGLRRAATHAHMLWTKDPLGSLTLGQVAKLRDRYVNEYPRSRIATVIDAQLPKVGFNTLPLPRLTRIAMEIARQADANGTDLQLTYEAIIEREGLGGDTLDQIRARAYVRGLLDAKHAQIDEHAKTELELYLENTGELHNQKQSIIKNIQRRLANNTYDSSLAPKLWQYWVDAGARRYIQEHDAPGTRVDAVFPADLRRAVAAELAAEYEQRIRAGEYDSAPVEAALDRTLDRLAMDMPDSDSDSDSEDAPEAEAELDSPITGEPMFLELEPAEPEAEPLADNVVDVHPMGMEMMGQLDTESIPMDPEPEETMTMIEDPTDPDGGMLEVTMRPVEAEPEPEPEPEGPMEAAMKEKAYTVYAYTNGRRASAPMDRFTARSMSAALQRIAAHGVRGAVRADPATFAQQAVITLDDNADNYLLITADSLPGKDQMEPEVNEQMPDSMATDDDGGSQLKSDDMGAQMHPHANLQLDAATIEHKVLNGDRVAAAGATLSINDDADVELSFGEDKTRTASMVYLDDVIADFMSHVAQNTPDQYYNVRELFTVSCDRCAALNECIMPDAPEDVACGCGFVTTAAAIADTFSQGNPVTGYVIVTDVPGHDDSRLRSITARRMLAAVKQLVPDVRGLFRRDAKLEMNMSADERSLAQVRKLLEQRYGVTAYEVKAQAMPQPQDAEGTAVAPPQPAAPAAPAPVQPAAPAPAQPAAPAAQAQPAATGTGAQQQFMAEHARAGFLVEYTDQAGKTASAPVEAKDAGTARSVFTRFNPDVTVVSVTAQVPPAEPDMGMEPPAEDMGMGMAPAPDMGMGMGMAPEPDMGMGMAPEQHGTNLSPDESDAVRAALTHYRNQGLGPMGALDQLNNQYKELIERYGEKTDMQRHMIEAEAMKLAAEVWMKPAVMSMEAGVEAPQVNTQQPDYVDAPDDLGPDSETDDGATNALEAPAVNEQVDTIAAQPGSEGTDTSTEPDSDNKDPGDYGAGAIKQQHPASDQAGTSAPNPDLGKDSDTGETKSTKDWESTSGKAYGDQRSQ